MSTEILTFAMAGFPAVFIYSLHTNKYSSFADPIIIIRYTNDFIQIDACI